MNKKIARLLAEHQSFDDLIAACILHADCEDTQVFEFAFPDLYRETLDLTNSDDLEQLDFFSDSDDEDDEDDLDNFFEVDLDDDDF